ncbi:hypothetical protein B0A48_06980 [Cryoendolithus antarcticus]|uniref:RNA-dependent RNA polymerase n=1 Tax=Cryoendolithus antarcticus TaxID=1507870 RepID=A0A1V8T9W3_9PEZI|nr:hypothetical protein B0A48_06980 [Cryoendolithus antarcticus]
MDVIVRNVPANVSVRQLKAAFAAPLAECGIHDYHCEPFRNHPLAKITVLDSAVGDRFLSQYGVLARSPANARPRKSINCGGRTLRCGRSKDDPSDWSLKALRHEAAERAAEALARPVASKGKQQIQRRRFEVTGVHCGTWDYDGFDLVFTPETTHRQAGTIYFGSREAVLLFGCAGSDQLRIDFDYWACENVVLGGDHTQALRSHSGNLRSSTNSVRGEAAYAHEEETAWEFPNDPHAVTGTCRVYRISVASSDDFGHIRRLVQRTPKVPTNIAKPTRMVFPALPRHVITRRLHNDITDVKLYGSLSFHVRYQLDRLARNGRLSPLAVMALLPTVQRLCDFKRSQSVAYAISRLYLKLSPAGPFVESKIFSEAGLVDQLEELCETSDRYHHHLNPYELVKRHQHIKLIHKIIITPTGTFLHGPEPEPVNRVLRKYPSHTDNFMRVIFQDEDGGSVRYDSQATQELVYHGRFKSVLDGSTIIASQGFTFLGFSHSSLRAQSCWFMAPLVLNGVMMYPPMVLKELGSFDSIRVPAKCASRIGQNFTDTNATIDIEEDELFGMKDLTRNNYDFSDGVGTISLALLQKIWRLQEAIVKALRCMTADSVNTETFLEEASVSKVTQMPDLTGKLVWIGIDYRTDDFLGRIPVPKDFTLYGIMDETGYLQEGQIFVISETQAPRPSASATTLMLPSASGGKRVLVKDGIIITRSPAMHPGDIQRVNAVKVPHDSPLQSLRNVVVFSQHVKRDLASQLSGGDLDGDLYNVIYDDCLIPPITYQAAEYPRVKARELDRPVTAKDMGDFFVQFMQSDQLGMLCNHGIHCSRLLEDWHRNIDEKQFLKDMQKGRHLAIARHSHSDVLVTLHDYVLKFAAEYGESWDHQVELARDISSGYEDSFLDILYNYSPTAGTPLSETEVFSGTIVGRQGGAQGKPLRELGMQMRECFEPVAEYCRVRIVHGNQVIHATEYLDELYDMNEREIEALPRAIACPSVGINESGTIDPRLGELKSFQYIAAAVCLQELLRYRITTFGMYTLPKLG